MQHYTKIAKLLHWVSGLIIIGLLAIGLYMVDQPAPDKYAFYGWHKSFGILALILISLRIIWRFTHRPPALPATMPNWQRVGSTLSHWGLYWLMFMMPLAGWVMSSAGGHPISMFGIPIPPIVQENKEIGKLANDFHALAAWGLIILISLHVAAALHHHYIKKDNVLRRMLPHFSK